MSLLMRLYDNEGNMRKREINQSTTRLDLGHATTLIRRVVAEIDPQLIVHFNVNEDTTVVWVY